MTCATDNVATARVFLFLPDPQATLDGGYDTVVMQKQDKSGTWFDITKSSATITITPDVCNYFYVDDNANPTTLFRPVLRDSTSVNPDIPQEERPALDTSYEAILTTTELERIYLFGTDLTDDDGNPFPAELFRHYIITAISQVEQELDLNLLPTKFVENYDFWLRDYEKYMFVQLANSPLIEVSKVALEYPSGQEIIEFPVEWVRTKHVAGQIEVLPARGTFTQLLVSAGGGFLPLVFGGADYIPDIIKIEYTAGFLPSTSGFGRQSTNAPQRMTHAIKEVVGKKAAFGPFNTAGDLIVGAGIATRSISIDGLSESIGTTSSATNAGYGARLIQYEKELKKAMANLRRFYKGPALAVA